MRQNGNNKKKIILLSVIAGVLILLALGIWLVVRYLDDQKTVEVIPVSQLSTYYWGDESYSSGTAVSDYMQEIYPDDTKVISEIFVAEGDMVAIGDPLLQYDKTKLEIDLEKKELELQTIDNSINTAQNQLKKLQNTKAASSATPTPGTIIITPKPGGSIATPSASAEPTATPTPTPRPTTTPTPAASPIPTPDIQLYSIISANSKPSSGTGTAANPYIYLCTPNCQITSEFMRQLMGLDARDDFENPGSTVTAPFVATFQVREGNSNYGEIIQQFTINGNTLGSSFSVSDSFAMAVLETSGDVFSATANPSASPSASPSATNANNYNDQNYTADELRTLIQEKTAEIATFQLNRKQIQLDLDKARLLLNNSTVLSTVDGVVKSLTDLETAKAESKPFLTVAGENTFYLHGTISESMLGSIHIGDEVTATSWSTGGSYTAEIVSIDDYPVDADNNYYGGGNPNSSTYAYIAVIHNPDGLYNGLWLEITMNMNAGENSDTLYIETMYIRNDDAGSYVMKAGTDNRLVKQYVETGKSIYGMYMEIKSGLTVDDYVAFPYGTDVKAGVRVKLQGTDDDVFGSEDDAPSGMPDDTLSLESMPADEIPWDDSGNGNTDGNQNDGVPIEPFGEELDPDASESGASIATFGFIAGKAVLR